MAIKKISTEFQLLDKFLDTSGNAGSTNQVLASTSTGIDWVNGSGSSIIGGPYLPLAGGTMDASANINMNSGTLSSVDSIDFGIGQLNGTSTSNLILKSLGDITYNVDSNNNGNSSHIFQESGSELMRIRYDGNVGIGTNSPGAKLHVAGTLNVDGVSTLANVGYLGDGLGSVQYTLQSANNGSATIDFGDAADSNIGRLSYSHVDDSFSIRTNNTTALTLDSSQHATFAGDIKQSTRIVLQDNGTIQWGATADYGNLTWDTGYALIYGQSGKGIKFGTNGSTLALTLDTSQNATFAGDVNIAGVTTSDGFRTDATNSNWSLISRDSAGNSPLYVQSANSGTGQWIARFNYGSATANGGTNVLTVAKDNSYFLNTNVGIGTNSPDYKLEVQGVISSADTSLQKATFANVGNDLVLTANADATNVTAKMLFNSSGAGGGAVSTKMIIDGSGNVGIGTTAPGRELEVRGGGNVYIKVAASTDADSSAIELENTQETWTIRNADQNNDALQFESDALTALTIQKTGNVGIGTTSPAANAKLTVMGNQTFGLPGSGQNTSGRFISIEGNADSSGEGSARVFFTEHNSSTAAMDNYGMSIGYRGGGTSITGASGNNWTGLAQINNGDWGMWGHDNNASGSLIMSGDRAATYVSFRDNIVKDITELRVSSKAGIGTDSPSATLDVSKNQNGHGITITQQNAGDGYHSKLTFRGSNGSGGFIQTAALAAYQQTNGANGYLKIFTGTSEAMRIDSAGNVGIGTTSPVAKLHVDGTAIFDTQTGAQPFYITRDGVTNQALKIHVDDAAAIFESIQDETADNYGAFQFILDAGVTEPYFDVRKGAGLANTLFRVDGSGNVGIGTTSPGYPLEVQSGGVGTVLRAGAAFVSIDSAGTASSPSLVFNGDTNTGIFRPSSDVLAFSTASTERMRIDPSGKVGIGTTNPRTKLHLSGITSDDDPTLGSSTAPLFVSNTARSYGLNIGVQSSGTSWLQSQSNTSSVAYDLSLNPLGGNVGIGTSSPLVKLDINSTDAIKVPVGTTTQRPTGTNGMLRYSTTGNQFEGFADGAWGAIGGGGGGNTTVVVDTFSGDNSDVTFNITNTIANEDNVQIYIDGVYQSKSNYSTSGATITFSTAPPSGTNNIEVTHFVQINGAPSIEVDTFNGNASTTVFTLTTAPATKNNLQIYIDGVYQAKANYSVSGTTLTFTTAPATGTNNIEVTHLKIS